jgi:hypothetical protein
VFFKNAFEEKCNKNWKKSILKDEEKMTPLLKNLSMTSPNLTFVEVEFEYVVISKGSGLL